MAVDVDDSIWFRARQAKKKQFTELGIWEEIAKINPDVEVRVIFSPNRSQPEQVVETLGAKGEFIANPTGSSISKGANYNSLEVETSIPMPFEN